MLSAAETAATAPQRNQRVALLGASVVPACVRMAFIILASGFRRGPVDLSRRPGDREGAAGAGLGWLQLGYPTTSAALAGPALPSWGAARPDGKRGRTAAYAVVVPPGLALLNRPRLRLVFDPSAYDGRQRQRRKAAGSPHRAARVRHPITTDVWATPRVSCVHATHFLSKRSKSDLPTQLRFERGTPAELRAGQPTPEFIEWLMGYPRGWTVV